MQFTHLEKYPLPERHFRPAGDMVDHGALDQIRFLMRDRFPMIVQKYIETSPAYIADIETGISRRNARLVAESAHPLRTSSLAMGARGVAALADRIELLAKALPEQGGHFDPLAPLLGSLKAAFEVTSAEFREILLRDKQG